MNSVKKELDKIFERNLKWRLLKKSFTSAEGLKVLVNCFRYYDFNNTGKINKENWISAILNNGLIIGITREDLSQLFENYKEENTDLIDYKKFSFNLFFKYNNKMSIKKTNISYNNIYNQTESTDNFKKYNNNYYMNLNEGKPLSQSQNILNINNNQNNSIPLINNDFNNFENNRYNYRNRFKMMNNLDNSASGISYSGSYVNGIKNSIDYFKSKININNGLNYYKFISDLKSKCSADNKILKNYLPIALQSIGVFYTQNELQKLFCALGCEDITTNTFSFSKMIEIIKDEMNDSRKNIVTNVFNNLAKNGNTISLNTLKQSFKPEKHPAVLNKRRNSNDIYIQFSESLDIFANLNNISNDITLEQFIDFYSGISSSILDDNYFNLVINNVWSEKENNIETNINSINNSNNLIKKSPSSPRINYNNLNIDNFNINYNEKDKNIIENYYSKNSLVKDRINNSNTKINLPLFYYNNTSNNKNLSSIPENSNQNINNSVFTPNSRRTNENILKENNGEKNIQMNSPSFRRNNLNLINEDLNNLSINNKNIDIAPIISKMREIFVLRGIKSIFQFQRMLYSYDLNHTGEISFVNFNTIIQAYNYNFSTNEIKNLFSHFDKENSGRMKYNALLSEILGTMNMMRFTLVKNLFDNFPKNQNGCIDINSIKNSFYPNRHNDVLNGSKTMDEVYREFLECLQIFIEYNSNLKGGVSQNELNYEEFCDFFGEISFGIQNDYIFSNYLQNCWRINN